MCAANVPVDHRCHPFGFWVMRLWLDSAYMASWRRAGQRQVEFNDMIQEHEYTVQRLFGFHSRQMMMDARLSR